MTDEAGLFYISFVGGVYDKFMGATIVYGEDEADAYANARIRGLVPLNSEAALVALYTQPPAARARITRLQQLPLSARQLLNAYLTAEEVKRYGTKRMEEEQITGYVCRDH